MESFYQVAGKIIRLIPWVEWNYFIPPTSFHIQVTCSVNKICLWITINPALKLYCNHYDLAIKCRWCWEQFLQKWNSNRSCIQTYNKKATYLFVIILVMKYLKKNTKTSNAVNDKTGDCLLKNPRWIKNENFLDDNKRKQNSFFGMKVDLRWNSRTVCTWCEIIL